MQRLKEMAKDLEKRGEPSSMSRILEDIAYSYHLAQTFPDGQFIPCSAWTWASYSFKGGKGTPTSLSLHVERDWASREFLVRIYEVVGGNEDSMDAKIAELMGQGRESENLAKTLFHHGRETEKVSPRGL